MFQQIQTKVAVFMNQHWKTVIYATMLMILAYGASMLISDTIFAQSNLEPVSVPDWLTQRGADASFRGQANKYISFFLGFLGFVAVAFIIFGGYLYVTAAGNQEQTDQGKKIIMYAAVGILIIFISYAIVNTLFGAVTNVEPTS